MGEHDRSGLPVVGASSLLVIFAVLCMTVFALLSISTARADGRLSDRAAAAVEGYYRADRAAEELLARLRSGQRPPEVTERNGVYTYACPISDSQSLAVAVAVEGRCFTVLRWQAVSTSQWEADESLRVWEGTAE